jgi:hypothetical protein
MNITIETTIKTSVFEIKHFEEDINTDLLNKLINSNLLNTVKWIAGNTVFENEKQQLQMLNKLVKNNKLKVNYKRPKYNLGRVYPAKSLSLCSLRREIRHTLAHNTYTDIDVANCHPEILNQLCLHHDIKTKYLNQYVSDRSEILKETMENYNCTRDEAKKLFISLMYYGTFDNWDVNTNKGPTDFIYNFVNELKLISEAFIKVNPDIVKIVKALQKKNEKGSVMSIILQEKERVILECVYNYLISKKIINNNDCVLCFDGIMIKANKYNIKLLDELSTVVFEELKFKLQFTEKSFDDNYLDELKSVVYERSTIYNNADYLELKTKFELNCFRLENPFNYVYIDNDKNIQLFNNEKLKQWAMKDYRIVIEDPEDEKRNKFFIDVWLTDPNQKTVNKIVFDPSLTSINTYNYFDGFKYTDGESAPLDNPFLNLVKRVCNDKKTYDYFIDWVAHIIQKPFKKTNIAVILYSNVKGVGKNCIVDGISKLTKGYSGHVETIEDITKNFNAHLVNKLFIYGDEIKASSKCISDKLKQVITRPTQNMEKKGKDAFEIEDYTNWLFTTNNKDAFKVEQGDRRLFFIECISEKLSKEASTEYYKYINDDEEMNKLFNYFKNHEITYNIGIEAPPTSRMKDELQFETKPAYIQLLYKQPREIINNRFTSQRLYDKSKAFASTNYLNHSYSITEFGTEMSKILKQFKKRTGTGYVYEVNVSFNEFSKILFEYDSDYYRFINNIEEEVIPTFTGVEDNNSYLD